MQLLLRGYKTTILAFLSVNYPYPVIFLLFFSLENISYNCNSSFPQFCKGTSEVSNTKTSIKTIKFSKGYPSRPVQGISAGLPTSLEWMKLHPSDAIHQSFCQFLKKKIWELFEKQPWFLLQHRDTRLKQTILQGLLESPLLGYLFLTRP